VVSTTRFLLDTNALSEPLKPRPNAAFLRKLRTNEKRLAIASVTWHEALFGLYRLPAGKRRDDAQRYLLQVIAPRLPILPYDTAAAGWHATERARLATRGITVPFADGQIAAVAKMNELTVVTAKVDDFARFDEVTVENWLR
jgi:tRNA(fMet)-specific endonuclease VapC